MARIRALKIGFFQNEHLAALAPHDRLLFAGLWVLADRAGRLEDRPNRIRAELFPYETLDVDAALGRLLKAGFIRRYQDADARYLDIVAFLKHQRPHPREPQSLIPSIDTVKPRKAVEIHGEPRKGHARPGGIWVMGSGSMGNGNGSGDLALIEDRALVKGVDHAGSSSARARDLFNDFWCCYPKHTREAETQDVFDKLKPSADLVARMISTLAWQVQQPSWLEDDGRFIPSADKWLRGERWKDEPTKTIAPVKPANTKAARTIATVKRLSEKLGGR
jgi:hypothetical protein